MTSTNTETAQAELLSQGLTWEDMDGKVFRTARRTVTEADLIQFVTWAGFNEPLFFDADHAQQAGYAGRLIPGAMIYCIAEGLILQSNVLNGTGLAFMQMDLSVKRPVFVGDTLHAIVSTVEARQSSKPGRGVVRSHVSVRNQRDEEVLVFTPVRLIRGNDFDDLQS
ncbi:MaoC/PaaZ C-terminal domain-containing protein [Nocardioides sp. WS12]|uniref:MaoC family dehydratase n=1 Tax=Nocardioides sp. WS12 TaxID=2486272 RepID=UPI0015F9FB93|nr:MaoC/PaaZ C-terminal domain-containing protein [Nocardioides sp. WS12]